MWLILLFIGAVFGSLINILTVSQTVDSLVRGLVDGTLTGAVVGGYALFVRDRWLRDLFRRMNFSLTVLVNGFVYLVLFQICRFLPAVFRGENPGGLLDLFFNEQMLIVIPVFFLLGITIDFILQMNLLIGHNVLRYFLLGTYHKPREEERIFLFLDLQGSTTLAEQMGTARYYALLEEFVNSLTDPILRCRGEIMGYVGDEVIVTWPREVGLSDANCIQCFFTIDETFSAKRAEFLDKFGVEPKYRAGIHGGTVMAGELGDIKREIVFIGDVMNTAARLEEFAKKHDKRLIVSGAVIDNVELPDGFDAVYLSDHQPRGKEETVQLYEVRWV